MSTVEWVVAGSVWAETSMLRREIVDATVSHLWNYDLRDLEAYESSSLDWPHGIFRSACESPSARPDSGAAVLLILGFAWQLADVFGHHVRLPHVTNLTIFVAHKMDQVELNLRLEEERIVVLESILFGAQRSPAQPDLNRRCRAEDLDSLGALRADAIKRREALQVLHNRVWNVRTQIETSSPLGDSRLLGLLTYIEQQLQWSDSIHGEHFSSTQALWARFDAALEHLNRLKARTSILQEGAKLACGNLPEVCLLWNRCKHVGHSVDECKTLALRHLQIADEAYRNWPTDPKPRQFYRRESACALLLRLAEWVEVVQVDAQLMADWHSFMIRRVDALSAEWLSLSTCHSALHKSLRENLVDYRRRAFEEIYLNRRWGPLGSSGGGSSDSFRTNALAEAIISLVAEFDLRTILDIGCGWGEWLPQALCEATRANRIVAGLRYIGWDVVSPLIESLEAKSLSCWQDCGISWQFQVVDGLETRTPQDVDLIIARHVLQHLGFRDALALLRKLSRAPGALVLLSQVQGATNKDLDDVYEGCSSFGFVSKTSMGTDTPFDGYDLRFAPFQLPKPLRSIPDGPPSEEMLLYRAADLRI